MAQQEKGPIHQFISTHKLQLAVSFLILLLYFFIILLVIRFFFSSTKKEEISQVKTAAPSPIKRKEVESDDLIKEEPGQQEDRLSTPLPSVFFETYENQASLLQLPDTINIYNLKTYFTLGEVISLGKKLGLDKYLVSKQHAVVYNTDNPNNRGILVFNLKTGEYTYDKISNIKDQISNININVEQAKQIAHSFLSDLGVIDQTVSCDITHQRQDLPDTTFVECHRDWDLAGLPIFNFLGVVNLSETKSLSDLTIGEEAVGEDRPDDFNTITVAVSQTGTILSLDSNLRQISAVKTIFPTDLLTPQKALEQFMAHKAQQSLTIPSGGGLVDVNRVYPANTAYAQKAVIADYLLAFLEVPFPMPMEEMTPMYLIRGTAELASGYRVRFAETLPALKSGVSLFGLGKVAGLTVQAEDTLKLGTFTLPPSPPPTVTATPKPPTVTPPSYTPPADTDTPPFDWCKPTEADLNPTYDLGDNLGMVGLYSNRVSFYYYVPPAGEPLPELRAVIAAFDKLNLTEGITQLRTPNEIYEDWDQRYRCPIRMTGGSPTLFVYGKPGLSLMIESNSYLIYADPPVSKMNGWEVFVGKGGRLNINGFERKYLYYEYEPVVFNRPDEGWVVRREELEEFVRESLSPSLGLNETEEERLVFEFNHATKNFVSWQASFDLISDYVFVGLIPQQEVEAKLPLEVTPKTDLVIRRHFYLAPSLEVEPLRGSTSQRRISKIPRADFMLLELGAVKGE